MNPQKTAIKPIPREIEEAIATCKAALKRSPNDANAMRIMGLIEAQLRHPEEALEWIKKSLKIAPEAAETHFNHAYLLVTQGRHAEAIKALQRAIELKPDYAEARHHLGDTYWFCGNKEEAIASYKAALAINPKATDTLNNLGNALKAEGNLQEALDCYKNALAINPNIPELYNNMGLVLQRIAPNPLAAELCFKRALELKPDYPDTLNNLGVSLRERGQVEEARSCCLRVLELVPNNPEGLNNLGLIHLHNDLDLEKAEASFRKALEARPAYPEALNNLGVVLRLQGRHDEGLACYREALALRPAYTAALNNLGNILKDYGKFPESIATYRQGLALQPDDFETRNNLAMALLAAGNFEEGWQAYEARWKTAQLKIADRRFVQPRWKGEEAAGKTLLVYAEQGFGDTLQFCRYIPMIAAKGMCVVFEAQRPLIRLLESLDGGAVLLAQGDKLPAFDLQCPMLSLPGAFKTTLETIPAPQAYLKATKEDIALWQARLPPNSDQKLKVGLVWAGSARKQSVDLIATDKRRSIAPDTLAPLLKTEGVQFFSLQKDGVKAPDSFGLIDLIDESRDFADTAALIENLDLVISVDTAVAHLAAALGKPVWLLNRHDSCWRWQRDRNDTPWYPTMRLFHQPNWHDWANVVNEVQKALMDLVKTKKIKEI